MSLLSAIISNVKQLYFKHRFRNCQRRAFVGCLFIAKLLSIPGPLTIKTSVSFQFIKVALTETCGCDVDVSGIIIDTCTIYVRKHRLHRTQRTSRSLR